MKHLAPLLLSALSFAQCALSQPTPFNYPPASATSASSGNPATNLVIYSTGTNRAFRAFGTNSSEAFFSSTGQLVVDGTSSGASGGLFYQDQYANQTGFRFGAGGSTKLVGVGSSGVQNFLFESVGSDPNWPSYIITKNFGIGTNAPTAALHVVGSGVFTGYIAGGVQSLSGPGAVNVTNAVTEVTTTGGANALTLADGVAGQEKTVVHGVKGASGSFVLTPTTKTGFTTFTSTVAGESITLVYLTTRGWVVKGSYLGVIAP